MASTDAILRGVSISGTVRPEHKKILTPEALAFLALLHRSFNVTRKKLLERRVLRQAEIDRGALPDFLPETRHIREDPSWKGAPPAPGLVDRRVEITGPTDRKMVVNALTQTFGHIWQILRVCAVLVFPVFARSVNVYGDRVLKTLHREL